MYCNFKLVQNCDKNDLTSWQRAGQHSWPARKQKTDCCDEMKSRACCAAFCPGGVSQPRGYNAGKKSSYLPTHEKTFKQTATLLPPPTNFTFNSNCPHSERRKSCGWEQTRSQLAGLYLVSTWHNLCFLSEEIDQTEMILGSRRHLRAQWFMNSFTCMEENGACELLG